MRTREEILEATQLLWRDVADQKAAHNERGVGLCMWLIDALLWTTGSSTTHFERYVIQSRAIRDAIEQIAGKAAT